MRAVQLTAWASEPQVRDIARPVPARGQVLLEVKAAGLCLSDVHVMDSTGDTMDFPLPLTLGHEVAGVVVEVSDDADEHWLSKQVVVHGIWGCGSCRNCRRGRGNHCLAVAPTPEGKVPRIGNGLGRPGGLAEFMLVDSSSSLVDATGLDPVATAPLADAGLTAYHAIGLHPGLLDAETTAIVVGIGGLGHLAVQILKARGVCRIHAVDNREVARDLALQHGASAVYESVADAGAAFAADTGADLILDFAGAAATLVDAPGLLAPGGRLVVVGSGGGRVTVGKDLGLANGWGVAAPFWGTRDDLQAVVDLAREGLLHTETTTCTLDEVPQMYRRLRSGQQTGRIVAVP